MSTPPPAPLEWHPAYDNCPSLADWLNRKGPNAGTSCVKVVFPRVPVATFTVAAYSSSPESDYRVRVLTRHKAWGPAPWAGRAFAYVWDFATDELGRSIAGESRIVYHDFHPARPETWEFRPGICFVCRRDVPELVFSEGGNEMCARCAGSFVHDDELLSVEEMRADERAIARFLHTGDDSELYE